MLCHAWKLHYFCSSKLHDSFHSRLDGSSLRFRLNYTINIGILEYLHKRFFFFIVILEAKSLRPHRTGNLPQVTLLSLNFLADPTNGLIFLPQNNKPQRPDIQYDHLNHISHLQCELSEFFLMHKFFFFAERV